jgi:glycosyltransferase involved in cell wall biosynthesis
MLSVHPPQMAGPGGSVRTYHFAQALADIGVVTLVCLHSDSNGGIDNQTREPFERVITSPNTPSDTSKTMSRSRLASWVRTLITMLLPWRDSWSRFASLCLQVCPERTSVRWSQRILATVLRCQFRFLSSIVDLPPISVMTQQVAWNRVLPLVLREFHKRPFDVIWLESSLYFPFAAEVQKACPGCPLVCNAQNIEYRLQERLAALAPAGWGHLWATSQAKFIRNAETRAFRESDLVIHCSADDEKLARELAPNSNHCVIGNGVDKSYFRRQKSKASEAAQCLFTGTFGYQPNSDGLRFFLESVFPLITARRPDCQFLFAGRDADVIHHQLKTPDSRVHFLANPDDMRPCFENSSVYVVPLRAGGGTRLKILEAMAMECAIVSTRIGAEGIPAENGRHLLLADTPQEFADHVVRLLNDSELRSQLESQAAEWVQMHYDWRSLCTPLAGHLNRLLTQS